MPSLYTKIQQWLKKRLSPVDAIRLPRTHTPSHHLLAPRVVSSLRHKLIQTTDRFYKDLDAELDEGYTIPQVDETQEAYHLSTAAAAHAAELDPRMMTSQFTHLIAPIDIRTGYRVEHSTKFQPGEVSSISVLVCLLVHKADFSRFLKCFGPSHKAPQVTMQRQHRKVPRPKASLGPTFLWDSVASLSLPTIRAIAHACETSSPMIIVGVLG